MDLPEPSLKMVFIGGTCLMLMIFFFVLLFVILYDRKKQLYHIRLQQMEIENQQKLLEAIITAQENEKQYFAGELHDSIGQLLSAINMKLNNLSSKIPVLGYSDPHFLRTLDEAKAITRTSINEARAISQKMMPVILTDFGLEVALNDLCARMNTEQQMQFELSYRAGIGPIGPEKEKALFRISQELLNNALKHSGAGKVSLSLATENNQLVLTCSDNGKGIDPGKKANGLGMKNIESRVKYISGTLHIQSSPGSGTVIRITLPIT